MVASGSTLPLWSINGTGISHLGYERQADGTYLVTRWITVVLFPLVPLSSWIIRPIREVAGPGMESRREFEIVRRVPLEPFEVLRTYALAVLLAAIAVAPGTFVFGSGLFARLHVTNQNLSVVAAMTAIFWGCGVLFLVNRHVERIYEIAEREAAPGR